MQTHLLLEKMRLLSTALLAGILLNGCYQHKPTSTPQVVPQQEPITAPVVTTPITDDKVAYMTQLGLVKGHLLVGYELYMAGHHDHAKTHMKHPESELYSDLLPAFSRYQQPGFSHELSQLANAVNNDLGRKKVSQRYHALVKKIEQHQVLTSRDVAQQFKTVVQLLNVAAEEYGIAVVDGEMKNAHEYQDAFGFTKVAHEALMALPDSQEKEQAVELIKQIKPHWPSLIPPTQLTTNAELIDQIASKISQLNQ